MHHSLEELEEPSRENLSGRIFAANYIVESLIGSGGNGALYIATHKILQRKCALKVLHLDFATDAKQVRRFQREARTISKLSHPNIIQVSAFGIEEGRPFIVMDYVDGGSLAWRLRDGPLSCDQALHLLIQICQALSYAHLNGVIHRDLKPGNIMLVESDEGPVVKLVDFGLARSLSSTTGSKVTVTISGDGIGTPYYMSPEQCFGGALDARSDIYSLGCLMYETVTGTVPHQGKTPYETMQKHTSETPRRPSELVAEGDLTRNFEAGILKAMSKSPRDRFQSASEWLLFLQGHPSDASLPAKSQRPAALVTVVFVIGLVAIMLLIQIKAHLISLQHLNTCPAELKSQSWKPSEPLGFATLNRAAPAVVTALVQSMKDAQLLTKKGEVDKAGQHLEQARQYASKWLLQSSTRDPYDEVRYVYCLVLCREKRFMDAVEQLEQIVKRLSVEPCGILAYERFETLIDLYIKLKRYDQAEQLVEKLLSGHPVEGVNTCTSDVVPRIRLSQLRVLRGDKGGWLEPLIEAEKIADQRKNTGNVDSVLARTQVRESLAERYAGIKRFSDALQLLEQNLELIRSNQHLLPCAQVEEANCQCEIGELYASTGRFDRARICGELAVQLSEPRESRSERCQSTCAIVQFRAYTLLLNVMLKTNSIEQAGVPLAKIIAGLENEGIRKHVGNSPIRDSLVSICRKLKNTRHEELSKRLSAILTKGKMLPD